MTELIRDDGIEGERRVFRHVIAVLVPAGATMVGATFVCSLARDIANEVPWMMQILRNHPGAVLGLPAAALAALCAVLFLEATSGRIEM